MPKQENESRINDGEFYKIEESIEDYDDIKGKILQRCILHKEEVKEVELDIKCVLSWLFSHIPVLIPKIRVIYRKISKTIQFGNKGTN